MPKCKKNLKVLNTLQYNESMFHCLESRDWRFSSCSGHKSSSTQTNTANPVVPLAIERSGLPRQGQYHPWPDTVPAAELAKSKGNKWRIKSWALWKPFKNLGWPSTKLQRIQRCLKPISCGSHLKFRASAPLSAKLVRGCLIRNSPSYGRLSWSAFDHHANHIMSTTQHQVVRKRHG